MSPRLRLDSSYPQNKLVVIMSADVKVKVYTSFNPQVKQQSQRILSGNVDVT